MKKAFIQKALVLVIASFTCMIANAQYTAQLEEKTIPVGEFNAIDVSDDFEVTLDKGAYGAKVTSDKMLAPYVQVYVRARTLHICFDDKAVPKDVRKLFKGRGAPTPVFRAIVSIPEINTISLSQNATLNSGDEFTGSNIEVNLEDKAQLKNLRVTASSVKVNMKKNASAMITAVAENRLEANTEGNAQLKLILTGKELVVSAQGSSQNTISAEVNQATINTAGNSQNAISVKDAFKVSMVMGASSDANLTGTAEELSIKTEKNPELDAQGFEVKRVEANMSGSGKASVNVIESIDATLVNGSSLYYTGTPAIKIGKIIKSTLAPVGATAK